MTPRRPVKRRLVFTTPRVKRARLTASRKFQAQNRFVSRGVSRSGTLRQQVKSLQTVVNKLKPEVKYVDIDLASTNIADATGTVIHLTAIAQGDTSATRTGNAVNLVNLHTFVQFTRQDFTTVLNLNAGIRIALVQDKEQVADTSPAAGDIFESVLARAPLPDYANAERFRVLYMSPYMDAKMMGLESSANQDLYPTRTNTFSFFKSLNLKVAYNGAASTDIAKNGLYFVIISTGFTDQLDCVGTCRVGYTDV